MSWRTMRAFFFCLFVSVASLAKLVVSEYISSKFRRGTVLEMLAGCTFYNYIKSE